MNPKAILVVDDEPAILDMIAELLGYEGYEVVATSQGSVALARAKSDPPALILLDLMMPGMNGRGLVERLAGIRPRIKSLYMSGYTDDDIVRRGFIEPSKSFLQKPFTSEALLQTVRKVLDEG